MLEGASLKRIAWAFGCARKGSDLEERLRVELLRRASLELAREQDEDHAHAAVQRVMRPTEHVSKPLARALEQIARKGEEG